MATFNSIWRLSPDGWRQVIFDKGAPFFPPKASCDHGHAVL